MHSSFALEFLVSFRRILIEELGSFPRTDALGEIRMSHARSATMPVAMHDGASVPISSDAFFFLMTFLLRKEISGAAFI